MQFRKSPVFPAAYNCIKSTSQDSDSQHLHSLFHISPCPLPSEAVALYSSVKAAEDIAWHPFPCTAVFLGFFLPAWGSRMSHSQLCADLPELMIPLSFRPRESGFPGAGCGHRFLTMQHSSVRIGEIDDFWGISYCFLFTLAFVCKPRNALCVSLTLPSQAFRATGTVLTSPQVPVCHSWCDVASGLMSGCLQVKDSARSPSGLNLDVGPSLSSPVLSASPWYLKEGPSPSEGTKAVWSSLQPLSPRATEIPHKSLPPLLSLQISYLYKHFLDCLSSHTAPELEHNSTEQITELGDLCGLRAGLQVVFVPIKQWEQGKTNVAVNVITKPMSRGWQKWSSLLLCICVSTPVYRLMTNETKLNVLLNYSIPGVTLLA